MQRPSSKWLALVTAALLIPALLVASGAQAAGKTAPCLNVIAGDATFTSETISDFSYTDHGIPLVEPASEYEVTWDRTGLHVEVTLAAGCTAAEAKNYRLTVAYPDGRTITSTPTGVVNDPAGVQTKLDFDLPQLEVVSDNKGVTASRGVDVDRVLVHVETFDARGAVVDRAPDSGQNEVCAEYQSADPAAACYREGGGGSSSWN